VGGNSEKGPKDGEAGSGSGGGNGSGSGGTAPPKDEKIDEEEEKANEPAQVSGAFLTGKKNGKTASKTQKKSNDAPIIIRRRKINKD